MNTQARSSFRLGFGQQATAFVFALACTLAMLMGVDGLSKQQAQDAQLQQMAQAGAAQKTAASV